MPKPQPGRPPLAQDEKRSAKVTVSFDRETIARVERAAHEARQPLATWVAQAAQERAQRDRR